MRMTTALSRRQVRATRRAGTSLGFSRAFVSSRLPERGPGGRGWPGLAGSMKAQIRVKTRNRGCDWAIFRRPDEKKVLPRASSGSWLEMLLCRHIIYAGHAISYMPAMLHIICRPGPDLICRLGPILVNPLLVKPLPFLLPVA
jgi:hypothetical protein